jgi:ferredoxin
MLYINPEECIDCAACIPACPVQAIYSEFDLPEDLKGWIEINAEKSQINPIISEQESPLVGSEERQKSLGF